MTSSAPLLAGLIVACALAVWFDLFQRRIPNWLCGAVASAGLLGAALHGDALVLSAHAAHGAIGMGVGMVLYHFGMVGGGDVKFYAAVATWFALDEAILLLLLVSLSGLLLFIGWSTSRRLAGKPIRKHSDSPFDSLPYAIAIAGGAVSAGLL